MGGGSWATALAKLLLDGSAAPSITWYMHRADRIDEFRRRHRNPAYLSDVTFDTSRIHFTDSVDEAASRADTLLLAIPSPYFRRQIERLTVPVADKCVVSAIKGIVPDVSMIVSDYMEHRFHINSGRSLVVSGPCHAEEVAMGRLSYLTVGCNDIVRARAFARALSGPALHTVTSTDVAGIEYAAVLKNVYAIAAGMTYGLRMGDNFTAMLVSNALTEMERFLTAMTGRTRSIAHSVYLGDLLVTAYSRFSRNHNFGTLLGRGCSVRQARTETVQTAEGYYAAKCIHEINARHRVDMPILEGVYDVLYRDCKPREEILRISEKFI